MGGRQGGIRVRGKSIQIDFYYRGQRFRETLKISPTLPNIRFAQRKKDAILYEIALGTFNYAHHFPRSRNAGIQGKTRPMAMQDALEQFLEGARARCAFSTWKEYKSSVAGHLIPAFGETLLSELTVSQIRAWMGTVAGSISNKRINNILVPLRSVLDDAFEDGRIESNPMDRIRNLAVVLEEPDPFSLDEVQTILGHLTGQSRNLFQFAFWTGLRTSELIALEWGDIDWRQGIACIRRATVLKQTKAPKTASGVRNIKLLPAALDALKAQRPFTSLAGKYIFHNPRTSLPWQTDQEIRKSTWAPALRRAGVRYRRPYQTRHTYASMMLSAGENPLWVAQQMGHRDWGMIRKVYGRWISDVDPNAGMKAATFWTQLGHGAKLNA